MRIGRSALRVAVGAGLAVLGLAVLGDTLSSSWEPARLPAGPLPPAPKPASPEQPADDETRSEDVRIPVRDTTLAGAVVSPAEAGRYPAVVLVHGAGPGRRSGLVEVAEGFAREGIVALAYDKRTVGYSAVTNRDSGLLAEDALAAVGVLGRRDEVDPARVGLWGISEGSGWVVPIAASRAPDEVAFAILASAPVVTPRQQLVWGAQEGLDELDAPKGVRIAAAKVLGMGGFDYVTHDPLPALERTSQPVLALYGTQDTAVPVAQSSRELAAALQRGGNRRYTIRFFDGADHGLRVADGRLAPGYRRSMTEWVRGLPATAEPPPGARVAGATPVQRYAASEPPPAPPYATGAALAVAFGLAAAGFLAGPVAALVTRRGRAAPGDDGAWQEVRRALRRLAAAGISTQVLFNVVLGASLALALTRTGSPPIVNGGWLVVRLAALVTVTLAVASADATVSAYRSGWRPRGVQAASLAGSLGATGILLLISAYWGLYSLRW